MMTLLNMKGSRESLKFRTNIPSPTGFVGRFKIVFEALPKFAGMSRYNAKYGKMTIFSKNVFTLQKLLLEILGVDTDRL